MKHRPLCLLTLILLLLLCLLDHVSPLADHPALRPWVVEEQLWVSPGEAIERFTGANKAVGTLIMNFPDRETLERYMSDDGWYQVVTRV